MADVSKRLFVACYIQELEGPGFMLLKQPWSP